MKLTCYSRLLLCFAAMLLLSQNAVADQIILDDDFGQGYSYSVFAFTLADLPPPDDNPDDVSFADFLTINSGGNPGEYLEVTHLHDVDRDELGDPINGDGRSLVQSILENESVSYNPAAEGTFTQLTMSIDYRTAGPFESVYFAVSDSGGDSLAGFETTTNDFNWQTYSITFDQSDLVNRDFSGGLDLRFGFGFTTPEFDVSEEALALFVDVDNFRVSISSIPEPGSWLLLASGGIGFLTVRRRKQK